MSDSSILSLKKASDAFSSISQYIWDNNNNNGCLLSDQNMLTLGDTLHGVLKESKIKIPKIVAVGTQSSGKSSVLNSLIGMDILPTGKDMVTRTPLYLEVIHNFDSDAVSYAEFGEYINGTWSPTEKTMITFPKPENSQRERISNIIITETCKRAGNRQDVSESVIHLRIISPHVSNISLIDLPGLTAIACTDRGQPIDIKQKIENLIGTFIKDPNTLILGIIAGRSDIEADTGLELIKKYDPDGKRTVGVFTKLDLMNDSSDIVKYLEDRVSKDLQLKHGYFAVRNRNNNEKITQSVQEGYQLEQQYFNSHKQLGKPIFKNKVSSISLKKYLAHLLTNAIKLSLPRIQTSISNELTIVQEKLNKLGNIIPENDDGKIAYLQNLLVDFCKHFTDYTLSRGFSIDTGRKIKEIFIKTRNNIITLQPFNDKSIVSDLDLNNIILNTEGNHMSFPYPPVEILEKCLQDKKIKSIQLFLEPLINCHSSVNSCLITLIDYLLNSSNINSFPELKQLIKNETIQNVIIPYSIECQKKLKELVELQINYIWTDDKEFHNLLLHFGQTNDNNDILPSLRQLLSKYVDSIAIHISDIGPKYIMYYFIKKCTDNLYTFIYKKIISTDVKKLLIEHSEIAIQRKNLTNLRNELKTAISTIERLS